MTQADVKKNYKDTLNLPDTAFAMQAQLTQNEPKRLARWQEMGLYQQLLGARKNAEKWILHDGPPFANGDIHIGHLINKTLKDVILRFRTMQGFQTPYVPGWDCHGLPIEHKIQQDLGSKLREMSVLDVRKRCFAYAEKYVGIQSEQFQRLGILGEWANPYLTMKPAYEASTLEVFAKIVEKGLVYRKLKPVPWSVANQTALADAELEYQDVTDSSVYVEFPLLTPSPGTPGEGSGIGDCPRPGWGEGAFLLVWTTTPWTLPANLAIAAGPEIEYAVVKYSRAGQARTGIVAKELLAKVLEQQPGITSHEIVGSTTGRELAGATYSHPFLDRVGKVVLADYVTTTDGTGLVHTAPGHGEDDYETGIREGLEVYSPVMYNGRFDDTVPEWLRGKTVWESNALITQKLVDLGLLFAEQKITHSYPHDWRSKTPIIFRATEQWFVAMDSAYTLPSDPAGTGAGSMRARAIDLLGIDLSHPETAAQEELAAHHREVGRRLGAHNPEAERLHLAGADSVYTVGLPLGAGGAPIRNYAEFLRAHRIDFVPHWGKNRMRGMLESRPDWCISRQRAWGLPIPVFYNDKGDALLTPESVRAVGRRFADKGSDSWFTDSPADLLGPDFTYPPGFTADNLRKEKDIFDVWFESGSSWHAVLLARPYLNFPADLYLEGSDQHRGWFQLSLLPSIGATGIAPFKQVLTHGFVVKPDGTKVSKSDKEYVKAVDEINRHGADVLRLWCCSVDYQNDIPASPKALQEFGDKYRKIRNTLKYLLSNLTDFNPTADSQEVPLNSLDGWASAELDTLINDVTAAYEAYQLHRVFRLLHDFCAVQISSMYGNALKDRLYCDLPSSPLRRRAQTVLHRMLLAITKLLAPMLVFTADEAWEHIANKPADEAGMPSVHLALLPKPLGAAVSDDQRAEWKRLFELRDQALLQLDALKKEVGLNKALDAEVIYNVDDDETRRRFEAYGVDLEDLVGAGFHSFAEKGTAGPAVSVKVVDRRETYKACARSWKRRPDVGQDAEYPDLSLRDAAVVRALSK
jgi:isoleucyl-tRNA synthetase